MRVTKRGRHSSAWLQRKLFAVNPSRNQPQDRQPIIDKTNGTRSHGNHFILIVIMLIDNKEIKSYVLQEEFWIKNYLNSIGIREILGSW